MFALHSSSTFLRIFQCFARHPLLVAGNATTATTAAPQSDDFQMRAWAVDAFGTPPLVRQMPIPVMQNDEQVLIRVKAASVNPIDVRMSEGYGNEIISTWKCLSRLVSGGASFPSPTNILQAAKSIGNAAFSKRAERADDGLFPLVLGRDCSGEVVEVGRSVKHLEVGDKVIATVSPHWQGCHAEYVLSSKNATCAKPTSLSHTEAASLPYVACTAWAALVTTGRVDPKNAQQLRVLIHGGSGGVGTMAIQMLRCWGVEKVVATCSAEKMKLVEELGAKAVDYRAKEVREQLTAEGPFELILDCANTELAEWSDELLGIWRRCMHVTINSSLLGDTDRYGLPMGFVSTGLKQLYRNLKPMQKGSLALPAFFAPNLDCLQWVSESVERGQLRPVIDEVFSFDELPKAYGKVGKLHGKGKTVIDFDQTLKQQQADIVF